MTIIAFVGSVFSPTYFAARARGKDTAAERFCALNVVLYRARDRCWSFTEHPLARIQRTAQRFDIGASAIAWEGDTLVARIDERSAGIGRPVRGTVRLRPHRCFDHAVALDPAERHHWWPVAPLAEIEVEMARPALRFVGSGYHDTNFGREPLERGFRAWEWSRAELPRGTGVLYDAEPREGPPSARGLLFGRDGQIEPLDAEQRHRLPRGSWGVARSIRADPGAPPRIRRGLESAPFYTRELVETTIAGHPVLAMHESLDLDRFAHPVVQRMLPFRIRRGWRV